MSTQVFGWRPALAIGVAWQWLAGPSADEERWIGGHIVAVAHLHGLLGAAGLWAVSRVRSGH